MMKWNGEKGDQWNWIRVIVIEVVERKNGIGIDGYEWIENIDTNGNEKQG